MQRPTPHRTLLPLLALGLLTMCVLAQQGCYRRVVGVRGLGGSTYDVSEPYQHNGKVDDWLFGPQRDPNDKIKTPTGAD